MKKKLAVLFILFAAVLTAGSVSEDLIKKQNKINEKQRQIDEKKKMNQIKYKDNKGKLAEKNADITASFQILFQPCQRTAVTVQSPADGKCMACRPSTERTLSPVYAVRYRYSR